jgi:hypothetical protein
VLAYLNFSNDSLTRETIAGFDSAGVPIYLSVLSTREIADSLFAENFVIWFGVPPRGHHMLVSGLTSEIDSVQKGGAKPKAAAKSFPLVEVDDPRLHDYATWVWNHKCERSAPVP